MRGQFRWALLSTSVDSNGGETTSALKVRQAVWDRGVLVWWHSQSDNQTDPSLIKYKRNVKRKTFQAEMGQRFGRTDRMTAVVLSLYKLPKTLPVTTLMLFSPPTLVCRTFPFILLSEGSVFGYHTLLCLWYYLRRRIRAAAIYHPSPHLKLSHRGGQCEWTMWMTTSIERNHQI